MEGRLVRLQVAADGAQAGVKKLAGREGQLITLRRRSRLPWTAAVQPLARAPCTAQLLIEIIGNRGPEGSRSQLVRRYQPLARCLDEEHFIGIEEKINGFARCRVARRFCGGWRSRGGGGQQRCGRNHTRSADRGDKGSPCDFGHFFFSRVAWPMILHIKCCCELKNHAVVQSRAAFGEKKSKK